MILRKWAWETAKFCEIEHDFGGVKIRRVIIVIIGRNAKENECMGKELLKVEMRLLFPVLKGVSYWGGDRGLGGLGGANQMWKNWWSGSYSGSEVEEFLCLAQRLKAEPVRNASLHLIDCVWRRQWMLRSPANRIVLRGKRIAVVMSLMTIIQKIPSEGWTMWDCSAGI